MNRRASIRRAVATALGVVLALLAFAALAAAYLGADLRRAVVFSGFGLC